MTNQTAHLRARGEIADGLSSILRLFSSIDILRLFTVEFTQPAGDASPHPSTTAISVRKIETFGVDSSALRDIAQCLDLPDLSSLHLMEVVKYSRHRFIEYL